jgi:hypothetical protein
MAALMAGSTPGRKASRTYTNQEEYRGNRAMEGSTAGRKDPADEKALDPGGLLRTRRKPALLDELPSPSMFPRAIG